jgi:putative transposase
MTNKFNFNDAVNELQAGKNLNGKGGLLTSLIK